MGWAGDKKKILSLFITDQILNHTLALADSLTICSIASWCILQHLARTGLTTARHLRSGEVNKLLSSWVFLWEETLIYLKETYKKIVQNSPDDDNAECPLTAARAVPDSVLLGVDLIWT